MDAGHHLIDQYLDRLGRAAAVLPRERQAELLEEIREHINQAVASGPLGEADVRALLDRLGPPGEIVAAAADSAPEYPPPTRPRGLALENWAVVMLSVGSIVLPVVGWLIGVVLLWSSDRWRLREKLLATLVTPGGLGGLLLLGVIGFGATACSTTSTSSAAGEVVTTSTCSPPGFVQHVLLPAGFIVGALGSLIIPFVLLHLARRRASRPAPGPASAMAARGIRAA